MKSMSRRATDLPSKALAGRVFACLFDDIEGPLNRLPTSRFDLPAFAGDGGEDLLGGRLNTEETYKLMRGNAITAFGLDQYFGIAT
jgi:hypothetical protein